MKKTAFTLIFAIVYSIFAVVYSQMYGTHSSLAIGCVLASITAVLYLYIERDRLCINKNFFSPTTTKDDVRVKPDRKKFIKDHATTKPQEFFVKEQVTLPFPHAKPRTFILPGRRVFVFIFLLILLLFFDKECQLFTGFLGYMAVVFWVEAWIYWKSGE